MSRRMHYSRRDFLTASAATASVAALAPRAYARILGANERIHFAVIGLGVMGSGHLRGLKRQQESLNLDVLQTCDVYRKRAEKAANFIGAPAAPVQQHEDVLGNSKVDAVLIATPDHWHARLAIDAIKARKHVYLEKPMCHTIEQALELAKAEQEHKDKVRVQVGVQATSFELLDKIREHIHKNGIGKLVMILSSYNRNNTAGPWRDYGDWEDIKDPGDAHLDWDKWLGHKFTCAGQQLAAKRDWDPKRFFQFRCYWDYSGGVATDLLFHTLTQLLKATGLEYPERVVASGGIWVFNRGHTIPTQRGGGPDDREVPDMYTTTLDYPGGPTVTLVSCMDNETRLPVVIAGHDATIRIRSDNPEEPIEAIVEPQGTGRIKERVVLKGERGDQAKHRANLVRAIRDPKVELYCPVSLGLRTNVAITLGVKSFRERKVYGWDAKEQKAKAM
ncbi:MAG TPA: Gfo/Idh/MocA family oxidoreductase [Gemmataceae bacterium]